MRILIFSDLHLHNHVYGATIVDGVNSRLQDGRNVLHQIAEYCEVDPVSHIVFAGDLFHSHGKLDASVLKVAYEGFQEILDSSGCYIDVIVGNHDSGVKDMSVHALHWLKAFSDDLGDEFIRVIDKPTHNWSGVHTGFSFLQYTESVDEIKEFFDNANETCFMHAGIDGVPMKSGFVPGSAFNTDMIPDHVQYVFAGHYHGHMKVTDKATVIGSPLQLNWADEGDDRGFIVYDTDTGEQEFIEIDAPKFVTINFEGTGWFGGLLQPSDMAGNFLRIVNHDPSKQESIREEFTGAGARSVEFVVKLKEVDRLQPLSSDGLYIPDAIRAYEKQKEVTPERRKVGEELRK